MPHVEGEDATHTWVASGADGVHVLARSRVLVDEMFCVYNR